MTEHEELLRLRALVAKMDAQLAEKDQIIDKQTEQLEERNARIGNMIQALLHARMKLFGSSTECTKHPSGQPREENPGSKGAEGREYINLLFQVEKEIKSLSPEEKKQKRQDSSRPILDAFWSWVEETSALHTTNEMLTKALTYATNQKEYLETFMEDGRLPISNNLCEANIKPFATARRAWLFAVTPKGAKANAVLYTLVESARLNDLDVFAY